MPKLLLLRHAKAAPYINSDAERPLAERGRGQCGDIALHFSDLLAVVDDARVSPAARTQETWQRVCQAAGVAPATRLDPRIYDASPGSLLEVVQELTGAVGVVVGHNPGIARLTLLLAEDCTADQLHFLQRFSTGAAAVLECAEPWELWQPGIAKLVELHAPAE